MRVVKRRLEKLETFPLIFIMVVKILYFFQVHLFYCKLIKFFQLDKKL